MPSIQPTAQPSTQPSKHLRGYGGYRDWNALVPSIAHLTGIYSIGDGLWVCGSSINGTLCSVVDKATGSVKPEHNTQWDSVTTVLNAGILTNNLTMGGIGSNDGITSSDIAHCAVRNQGLKCSATSYRDVITSAATIVSYAKKLVFVGTYSKYAFATIVDAITGDVQNREYTGYITLRTFTSHRFRVPPSLWVALSPVLARATAF